MTTRCSCCHEWFARGELLIVADRYWCSHCVLHVWLNGIACPGARA